MKNNHVFHNKMKNLIHTAGMLAIMVAVTGLAAYMIMGPDGIWLALIGSAVPILFSANVDVERLLRHKGAQPLSPTTYRGLYQIAATVAGRAGLSRVPRLFCEPSGVMNGYATGSRDNPVIVLSDVLLQNLSLREIAGILGHETAHIKNNDIRLMVMAATVQRIAGFISTFGQVILIFALPLILVGKISFAIPPMLFIVFAPTIVMMLQMAISRAREFEADQTGCELTGDPAGLAQALYKLEKYHRYYWRRLLLAPWSRTAPSWLQSHPPTVQRIRRIMALAGTGATELCTTHG